MLSNRSIDDLSTLNAIGYLAILLRHEDGWVPSVDKIVQAKNIGRDAAKHARRELVRKGYYVRVSFQYEGGVHGTDIWRSVCPHGEEDLDQIAAYYQRGVTWQISAKDADGNHERDSRGRTVTRPVTIWSAQMESWRAETERISDGSGTDGEHDSPDPGDNETAGCTGERESAPGTSPGGKSALPGGPNLR